jgi:hypothetical protein
MKACIMTVVAVVGMLGLGTIARADDAATTVIRPRTTDVIKATIHVGHLAEVVVIDDGDTDLDLYVYDPCGRLVGCDDETDRCYVRFFPRMSGTYTIKVVNRLEGREEPNYTGRTEPTSAPQTSPTSAAVSERVSPGIPFRSQEVHPGSGRQNVRVKICEAVPNTSASHTLRDTWEATEASRRIYASMDGVSRSFQRSGEV